MIDYCEAKRRIDDMPWPDGTKPLIQISQDGDRAAVHLYDAKKKRTLTARAPTAEFALRVALGLWLGPKPGLALEGPVADDLRVRIERLKN